MIARLSAVFALTADLAMGLLGGKLKRMELLSARLGDVLSCLYLASACVWRYEVERRPEDAAVRAGRDPRRSSPRAAATLRDLYANLPSPCAAHGRRRCCCVARATSRRCATGR